MNSLDYLTVGPVQENTWFASPDGERCVVIDPGEEADRILGFLAERSLKCEAILLTHTHFDHIGAVAPVATATGVEVWCPRIELPVLANINDFVPWPGFGPFDSWEAEHPLDGGELLQCAGMEIEVISTPGHSPGHVTFAFDEGRHLVSGDVLFQGSVGRTDVPGGDMQTLLSSISRLLDRFDPESTVNPGHGPPTTLGAEAASNPFLTGLVR